MWKIENFRFDDLTHFISSLPPPSGNHSNSIMSMLHTKFWRLKLSYDQAGKGVKSQNRILINTNLPFWRRKSLADMVPAILSHKQMQNKLNPTCYVTENCNNLTSWKHERIRYCICENFSIEHHRRVHIWEPVTNYAPVRKTKTI